MNSQIPFFLCIILSLFVSGCARPKGNEASKLPASDLEDKIVSKPEQPHEDPSALTLKLSLPEDTAKILTTGRFHEGEVWEGADKEEWFELYRDDTSYHLSKILIETRRVKDEIMDMEGEISGWEVSSPHSFESVILIAGVGFLQEKTINKINLSKNELFPGDTVSFEYKGTGYALFSTGEIKKSNSAEPDEITDYKLYLTTAKKEESTTQLLVAEPHFDGAMTSIIFAGDIDGDDIPDLIIDRSNHYNVRSPALYLSKPAPKGRLLKLMGEHRTVGC